jgi:hypothetical protein
LPITELLILTFFLFAFTFALIKIPFFHINKAKKSLVPILWAYKLGAGLAFYLIFSLYQPYSMGCDSQIYFEDGEKLANVAKESPADYFKLLTGCYGKESTIENRTTSLEYWNRSFPSVVPNDNRIVIRINSLFSFISFGYYRVHLLFMAFLSFIGLFLIYKSVTQLLTGIKRTLLFAIFIIPSTVFWSAGDLKEPILVLLMGVFMYGLVGVSKKADWKLLFLVFVSSYLLIYTKPYILMLIAPCSISFFIVERFKIRREYLIYFAVFAFFEALSGLVAIWNPEYSLTKLLAQKQFDFISMLNASHSGSTFEIPILENSLVSLIKNSPMALFNSISRPWIWEPEVWPQALAAIENMAVICTALILILKFRVSKIEHRNIALFALFFSILLFILTGLITPNMGALVRYKSIGLPFLFIALVSGYSICNIDCRSKKLNTIILRLKTTVNRMIWED